MRTRDIFEPDDEETEHPTHLRLPKPLEFLAASSGGLRLVIVNESIVNTHVLPLEGPVLIGRGPEADVFVPHPSVSRRHAILRVGPTITLEDLGSSNGTTVNNVALTQGKKVAVLPSDAIRIGHVLVVIQVEGAEKRSGDADGTALVRPPQEPEEARERDFEIADRKVLVRSESMERIFALAGRVAQTKMSVLVLGETGTGKEIVAHSIHARSNRRDAPFLVLNCAALSEPLLESELFGHEKGAFTGAHETKVGLFEKAGGGTVFLDEVGDTSLQIQAKLLRVFEERRVLRLGGTTPRPIEVRFVTATNKNLGAEVAAGRFRKDFLFRLSGLTIHVPPLRERLGEIEPLARHFAERFSDEVGRPTPELTPEALARLGAHSWPGNVRELKNVLEHAVVLSDGGAIRPEHLQLDTADAPDLTPVPPPRPPLATERTQRPTPARLAGELDTLEKTRIVEALERTAGNQTKAAELLGMPRRTFVRKLAEYGIQRPRRKPD